MQPEVRQSTLSWHSIDIKVVLKILQTSADQGLSSVQIGQRHTEFGPNELRKTQPTTLLTICLRQFKSPLICLLIVACLIAFGIGEKIDALVILTVLLINAFIGTYQEKRAEVSLEALRRLTNTQSRVIRDGIEEVLDSTFLVPGDILLLNEGDAVGADARILHSTSLSVSEASLTGESMPVSKMDTLLADSTPLADRKNMLNAGTYITKGKGTAVVVAIGQQTEIGQIADLTQSTQKITTPLEEKIAKFSTYILIAAFFVFFSVIAIGFFRDLPFFTIFSIALTQVVSMVPEGLPVAMTVALAVGVQRMAKRGAIVRKLDAVETLGSTTVICTDKTGTLTRNEMTVTQIYLPSKGNIELTGAGYDPQGHFIQNQQQINPLQDDQLTEFIQTAALCNDAKYFVHQDKNSWKTIGDPTEISLLTMVYKAGIDPETIRDQYVRLGEIPFNSESKMMAVLVEKKGTKTVFIKGAPEAVLRLCNRYRTDHTSKPFSKTTVNEIKKEESAMAENALRLLAFAAIEHPHINWTGKWDSLTGACYLGFSGQFDPPRAEVKEAVQACRTAGIRPVIITGDHKVTGLAIAKMLEIARKDDVAIDGQALEALSEKELESQLKHISVFARVHPAQKLQIVQAWQKNNAIVAMTGDGVNDAPALVKADVGVAMGITGTEVAKEAAKIVITDDNFATIVRAVLEGRIIHRNLKKMLLYLLSTNITELIILYFALIFGYPLPLAAVQILWINLVTDGVSQIPMVLEPGEGNEMHSPPIPRNEPLINKTMLKRMAFMTPAMAASTLFYFLYRLSSDIPFNQVQTGTFTILAVCQWFNALNCRSETRSAFSGFFKNRSLLMALLIGNLLHMGAVFLPPLNRILHTVPMPLSEVFIIGSTASLVLWVEELRKLWVRCSKADANRNGLMNDLSS
jgi:Ca2+-transporting ATPase